MINETFYPEESRRDLGRYSGDYRVTVSSYNTGDDILLGATDADHSTTIVELSLSRAREIAKILNAAADDVEARRPCRVGDTGLTAEQLDSLPRGSVVQFAGTRHAMRIDGAYYGWLTDSGADWHSRTLASEKDEGGNKLLFIPEVSH